ncbi:MAG: hypothetical protein KGS72_29035 [Cyanobacteria bacterium REEB67]|nr:hypothetical protein [Cyanobacteria bacterium REEB67]
MKKDLIILAVAFVAFVVFVTPAIATLWLAHGTAGTVRVDALMKMEQLTPWLEWIVGLFIFIDGGLAIRKQLRARKAAKEIKKLN